MIALGLLIGAWFGRARWLIALGLAMAAALGISSIAEYQVAHDGPQGGRTSSGSRRACRSCARDYELTLRRRDARPARRRLHRADEPVTVSVNLNVGELKVILPPNVDVTGAGRRGRR